MSEHKSKTSTLCWKCKRALDNSCEWCRDYQPVPGWEATPTLVNGTMKNRRKPVSSYCVHSCPKFINDSKKAPTKEKR